MDAKAPGAATEARIRKLCLDLPGVEERLSHGAPAFFAKRQFVQLWPQGHHERTFPHLWCAAAIGVADDRIRRDPDKWFRPPYVGSRGWAGLRLDGPLDWDEIEEACVEAFVAVAPPNLLRLLEKD